MTIAALESETSLSRDEDSAALLPLGMVVLSEFATEMMVMLGRATDRVGLEWNPPLCPEPSRLDDRFLGEACAGSQHPAPVPFFHQTHRNQTSVMKLH